MSPVLPIKQIPNEVLATLRGIFFDVDDTVTCDGRLEREAFDAMWRAHDAGIVLVAVTGRPLGWVDVIARHWPVSVAVGENGAGWVSCHNGRAQEGYFHSEAEREQHKATIEAIRRDVAAQMPHVLESPDQHARRCDLAFDVGEAVTLPATDIDELRAIILEHGASAPTSTVHAHAVVGDWDKAKGCVRATKEALGIDLVPDEWAFIGDSGNDEAAFAFFPVSVGVANVVNQLDSMHSRPKYVTKRDRGRGFSEFIATVLQGRQ